MSTQITVLAGPFWFYNLLHTENGKAMQVKFITSAECGVRDMTTGSAILYNDYITLCGTSSEHESHKAASDVTYNIMQA